MFSLYEAGPSSTVKMVTCKATAAIAIGTPVKMAAGDSGATVPNVTAITGGQDDSDLVYGIAATAASADNDSILIIPIRDGQVWMADAAANCDITKASLLTTFIAASTFAVTTAGTISNYGNKVIIVGYVGATTGKKYLVEFNKSTCLFR